MLAIRPKGIGINEMSVSSATRKVIIQSVIGQAICIPKLLGLNATAHNAIAVKRRLYIQ